MGLHYSSILEWQLWSYSLAVFAGHLLSSNGGSKGRCRIVLFRLFLAFDGLVDLLSPSPPEFIKSNTAGLFESIKTVAISNADSFAVTLTVTIAIPTRKS